MSVDETRFARALRPPDRSFFLFGPRSVGKSTWLRTTFPSAPFLDLLEASLFLDLAREPARLEALVGARPSGTWVVVDEIAKAPHLLDEVHRLIEKRRWRFALCSSSARRLRRGGVNLLGGRALTRTMEGFTARELGDQFDEHLALDWGSLPSVQTDQANAAEILASYVHTYLKEEIKEEGLVRRVPPFLRFLMIAGLLNGQVVNALNIARDAAVPRSTVDVYFQILEDTLVGHFLPAYHPGVKVRERRHPKFYWFDPGVARAAAGLLREPIDRLWKGVALETLIFHELRVQQAIAGQDPSVYYHASGAQSEVDFVVQKRRRSGLMLPRVTLIEVKLAREWNRRWERSMRSLRSEGSLIVDRMIGIYMGPRSYRFDGLDVLPVKEFLVQLAAGAVV